MTPGSIRLLRRANDSNQDQESEEPDVRRVLGYFPIMPRGFGEGSEGVPHQSNSRNFTPVLELDSVGLHFRNQHHRSTPE
jgi:hypothetical protein